MFSTACRVYSQQLFWPQFQVAALSTKVKTGVLFMNMGGPEKVEHVADFLTRLFSDRDIIQMPFQKTLSKMIVKRRTPAIMEQYDKIGGGSPIKYWTDLQGQKMTEILDRISPQTAPHKHYIGFRYVHPLTEEAIQKMEEDGVERAVAFSQYPQYSCATTGSSLNAMFRYFSDHPVSPRAVWSVIDRWPTHSLLAKAFADLIRKEVALVPPDEDGERQVTLLFSAHSLPMDAVNRGDPYPQEVGATVQAVMQELQFQWPYRLVWQSKVGPKAWLGPQTGDAILGLGRLYKRHRGAPPHAILIPIAFTSEHIETLYEMDEEYCKHTAAKSGLQSVRRVPALNDHPFFIQALADVVKTHLEGGRTCSVQLPLRCPKCENPMCGRTKHFLLNHQARLDEYNKKQATTQQPEKRVAS